MFEEEQEALCSIYYYSIGIFQSLEPFFIKEDNHPQVKLVLGASK
jgi:hypothetical protein